MQSRQTHLPFLTPGQTFPVVDQAWGPNSPADGLLAAGGQLDVETLKRAYSHGIFPWFSEGQPILWWSPNPRMTLDVANFRLHRSLKQSIEKFRSNPECEVRFDTAFESVITLCAQSARRGQPGTWILPDMVEAYIALHRAGFAHSVETWVDGRLTGGLYCVAIGKAIFGESMFSLESNASKIALCAVVCFCKANDIKVIDCQQNTPHLASLGATEIGREVFLECVQKAQKQPVSRWYFEPLYWNEILVSRSPVP